MISEHAFSSNFASFWKSALPNLESVVRALNLAPERFLRPIVPRTLASRRDIVSETGFRLFGYNIEAVGLTSDPLISAHADALKYLRRDEGQLSADEVAEVRELSGRLLSYVRDTGGLGAFMPPFAGHGMMTACQGDLIVGGRLVEVKYVDRSYRSTDLRQILCYCGLRYFQYGASFEEVSVFNPLRGTAITVGLEELIDSSSGRAPAEFFSELSYVLASGEISR